MSWLYVSVNSKSGHLHPPLADTQAFFFCPTAGTKALVKCRMVQLKKTLISLLLGLPYF